MARTKRSSWKGPFLKKSFYDEIIRSNNAERNSLKKQIVQTTSRNSVILPFCLGKIFRVHNGKAFIPLTITEEMLGHKIGEFVPTRFRHVYKKKR